jgi:hypothetical protein
MPSGTSSVPSNEPTSCPSGQQKIGTRSDGSAVCSTVTTTTENGQTTTIKNPDGTTTTTTTTDSTNSGGGSGTTTTTTTTDGNGNGTTIKTTTGTGAGASGDNTTPDFCADHPGSSICYDNSVGGGLNCEDPPICNGDPVQCAILFKEWQQFCQLDPLTLQNQFSDDYDASANIEPSNIVTESSDLSDFKVTDYVSASSECPGSIQIPLFGDSYDIDLSFLCGYLAIVAIILKTSAWIFVGRLLVTGI